MDRLKGITAVLLDMDGTLVDSDASVERAWRRWCAEYGVDAASALAGVHGHPADATVRRLRPDLPELAVAEAAQRQLELQYGDVRDVVAAKGALLLLRTLARQGVPWCVVTSADLRLAGARLSAAGIDPRQLVTVQDVRQGKPDPEGYLLAAAQLGVAPRNALVVEDSAPGLEAGRRSGAVTASLRGLAADLVLADLAQLADLFTSRGDGVGDRRDERRDGLRA